MHALGTYALVHALMSSLDGCLDVCDDLLLLTRQGCGDCRAGMDHGRQIRCRGGD